MALVTPRLMHPRKAGRPIAWIYVNGEDIGAYGANHLMSCGRFRSFGFVLESCHNQMENPLLRGFMNCLKVQSSPVEVYAPQPGCAAGSERDIDTLSRWLAALPAPAAVMTIYDLRTTHVLAAAQKAGIVIPKQMSVIGVDNDELLCDFTTPTLTSIALDYVLIGKHAAHALDDMMNMEKRVESLVRTVDGGLRIVERESTAHLAPAVSLAERALAYIRQNALSEINVKDVVEHLGVSRRLADRRFREIMKSSIMETIIGIRLDAVKERLASTSLKIGTITRTCGFRNENYAKNMFRKRFGLSMREWRNRYRQASEQI